MPKVKNSSALVAQCYIASYFNSYCPDTFHLKRYNIGIPKYFGINSYADSQLVSGVATFEGYPTKLASSVSERGYNYSIIG